MMGDRLGHSKRNHVFAVPNSRVDLDQILRSESPPVLEFLLRQQLKEEIEKNPVDKVRYVDSELHLRNLERSPACNTSEVQSTTLDIGVPSNNNHKQASKITITPAFSNKRDTRESNLEGPVDCVENGRNKIQQETASGRSCQVCLVKEVRRDLMNINKMVQEQTEQIRQLKTKCLRSYFERQI